ncbi:hypothetical protein OSB04_009446 [Centaurea solstitialis]|uniref:acylphosphatase n=1 Tax=Centaurea solstitialis TaxID=347529 RepID=A0AA38TNP8_9ASTR|nr:hypothetical protein OSB04_009446 [Centaurea solstitialis]
MAAERVTTMIILLKSSSQIRWNHLHTLRNQIQIGRRRFPQFQFQSQSQFQFPFPFRPLIIPPAHFHLPIRHPHPLNMSSLASPNNPPPDSSTPIKTVRVMIKGKVQGVFYRNWTVENAQELGLKGWVRNRRDGSVEALFSGSPDKVGEMQERCRRGPPSAVVTGLDVSPSTEDPGTGFERLSTV